MAHVTATLEEGLRVTINTDRHRWFADEPTGAGGTDTGPSPYELLLGSLAACTVMTLRLYTDYKGIKVDRVRAEYQFARIREENEPEGERPRTDMWERITASITIGGNFDEAVRKRLTQIVGRCPVHKTLAAGVEILDYVTFENGTSPTAEAVEAEEEADDAGRPGPTTNSTKDDTNHGESPVS